MNTERPGGSGALAAAFQSTSEQHHLIASFPMIQTIYAAAGITPAAWHVVELCRCGEWFFRQHNAPGGDQTIDAHIDDELRDTIEEYTGRTLILGQATWADDDHACHGPEVECDSDGDPIEPSNVVPLRPAPPLSAEDELRAWDATTEDMLAVAGELLNDGHTPIVRNALAALGVALVTDVPEDSIPAFMRMLLRGRAAVQ